MGDLFAIFRDGGTSEYQNKGIETEVSRCHSTEEVFVMKMEGRTKSLKQEPFFLK